MTHAQSQQRAEDELRSAWSRYSTWGPLDVSNSNLGDVLVAWKRAVCEHAAWLAAAIDSLDQHALNPGRAAQVLDDLARWSAGLPHRAETPKDAGVIYWENGQWAARYLAVDTPFGTLRRLVPGSLVRVDGTPSPPEKAQRPANGPSLAPRDGLEAPLPPAARP